MLHCFFLLLPSLQLKPTFRAICKMPNLYEEPQSFLTVSVLLFIILFLSLGGKRCWWRSKQLGADGRMDGFQVSREGEKGSGKGRE